MSPDCHAERKIELFQRSSAERLRQTSLPSVCTRSFPVSSTSARSYFPSVIAETYLDTTLLISSLRSSPYSLDRRMISFCHLDGIKFQLEFSPVRPLRCILPAVPPDCIVSFPSPRVFPQPCKQASALLFRLRKPDAHRVLRAALSLAPPSSPSIFSCTRRPALYGAVCLPLRCRAEWQERLPPPQTAPAHNPRGDTTMHFLPVPLRRQSQKKASHRKNRFRQLSLSLSDAVPHFPQFGHLPVAVRLTCGCVLAYARISSAAFSICSRSLPQSSSSMAASQ